MRTLLASRWFQYPAALLLIALSFYLFVDYDDLAVVARISASDFAGVLAIALVIYSLSGLEYRRLLYQQTGRRLSPYDVVTLPIAANLWSFIIPFQGAMVYSTLYLKAAYRATLMTGVALSLFSYLISIVLTGLAGAAFALLTDASPVMLVISLALACSPIGIPLARAAVEISPSLPGVLGSAMRHMGGLIEALLSFLRNTRTVAIVVGINLIHTGVSIGWNLWIARSFGFEVPLLAMVVFTLCLRLSIILKLTPGNIGLQEFISGGVFGAFGFDPAHGVLISLMARIASVLLMVTIGVAATMRAMRLGGMSGLLRRGEDQAGVLRAPEEVRSV